MSGTAQPGNGFGNGVFPSEFRFRGNWRPYQERLLDELDAITRDRQVHVVAAPGAGKTVLGLEIFLRFGLPTLVCAPSTTIRDQWRERLLELFWEPEMPAPDWCAFDITPGALVILSTYQQIDSWCRQDGRDAVVKRLRDAGVQTLVLDEAHHLRKAWWEHLFEIKKRLENPCVVALTATPPYDAPQLEWNRYIGLAGPVGDEISIPELVGAGTLCPHQDYLYLLHSGEREREQSQEFRRRVTAFLSDLALEPSFQNFLAQHSWLRSPRDPLVLRSMLRHREAALSFLIWLQHATGLAPESMSAALGLAGVDLPPAGVSVASCLLTHLIFRDPEARTLDPVLLDGLEQRLRGLGAVHGRQVDLAGKAGLNRRLRASATKIRAVAEILEVESREMGSLLCAAVITDHIRPEAMGNVDAPGRLGVVPIFEHLRRVKIPGVLPAILCGRMVVIPQTALHRLRADFPEVEVAELPHDPAFVVVDSGGDGARWVGPVTTLLTEGWVNVLVSTGSLLGQGWDAPSLNTIILASSVGSSIATNQYRGRVLRINPARPNKVSSIWHLVCHDWESSPESGGRVLSEALDENQAGDWDLINRRFSHFAGIHTREPCIAGGLDRIFSEDLNRKIGEAGGIPSAKLADSMTAWFCTRAGDRSAVPKAWSEALGSMDAEPASNGPARQRLAQELFYPVPRLEFTPIARLADGAINGGSWLSAFRRWRLHRILSRVARALHAAMRDEAILGASKAARIELNLEGHHLRVRLNGAPSGDQELFLDAFMQIFDPFCDPVFLIHSRDRYFCVPPILTGRRRAPADHFARLAGRAFSRNARVIYALQGEGVEHLAKARTLALKQWFQSGDGERRMVWLQNETQTPWRRMISNLRFPI